MYRELSSRQPAVPDALVRVHLQQSEGEALHVAIAPTDATTLTMRALGSHPRGVPTA